MGYLSWVDRLALLGTTSIKGSAFNNLSTGTHGMTYTKQLNTYTYIYIYILKVIVILEDCRHGNTSDHDYNLQANTKLEIISKFVVPRSINH